MDSRGSFVKTYQRQCFSRNGIDFCAGEEYYSESVKNALRGMHFQLPPVDHEKLIFCLRGSVLDVCLDLRKESGMYGAVHAVILSEKETTGLFIPKGVAHGFLSLEEDSLISYAVSTEYSPEHDCGIHWDSFGFKWPSVSPIVSPRDSGHPVFSGFSSPF